MPRFLREVCNSLWLQRYLAWTGVGTVWVHCEQSPSPGRLKMPTHLDRRNWQHWLDPVKYSSEAKTNDRHVRGVVVQWLSGASSRACSKRGTMSHSTWWQGSLTSFPSEGQLSRPNSCTKCWPSSVGTCRNLCDAVDFRTGINLCLAFLTQASKRSSNCPLQVSYPNYLQPRAASNTL